MENAFLRSEKSWKKLLSTFSFGGHCSASVYGDVRRVSRRRGMRTRELTERSREHVIKPITGSDRLRRCWCRVAFGSTLVLAIPRISLATAIWFYRSRALSSSGKCWPPVSRVGRQKRRSSLSFGSINGTLRYDAANRQRRVLRQKDREKAGGCEEEKGET